LRKLTMKKRIGALKGVAVALLLILVAVAGNLAFTPVAHASGVGHYQRDEGLWHTSIDITYEVDSGHVSWVVNSHCWVDSYYLPWALDGIYYYVQCSLFDRPAGGAWDLVDYKNASHSEPMNVFTNPAAKVDFSTEYSAAYTQWEVEITGGNIVESLGSTGKNLQGAPVDYTTVDATT
jgi:hypothetical protein